MALGIADLFMSANSLEGISGQTGGMNAKRGYAKERGEWRSLRSLL